MNRGITLQENNLLKLIQMSLEPSCKIELEQADWNEIFSIAQEQALAGLIAQAACSCNADNSAVWEQEYFNQIKKYNSILNAQGELHRLLVSNGVEYAVLKGCSAAIYYPETVIRTMGDIDFIVADNQFEKAFNCLRSNGYYTNVSDAGAVRELNPRHAGFIKDGVTFELHRIFATDNNLSKYQEFNDLIKSNIDGAEVVKLGAGCEFSKLPDIINGVVLLQHINQHIKGGLGLRQFIDWVMFVKCSGVDVDEFRALSEHYGLWQLAVHASMLGRMYLGLGPEFDQWCVGANSVTCQELMQKIFHDGNFGYNDYTAASIRSTMHGKRNPIAYFKRLQLGGLCRWEAAQRHAVLRPFAWAYQLGRVVPQLLSRDDAIASIKKDIKSAEQERELLEIMGLK